MEFVVKKRHFACKPSHNVVSNENDYNNDDDFGDDRCLC